MKCPKCGNEFTGNFCPICGTPVNMQQPIQPPFQQPIYQQPQQPQYQQAPPYSYYKPKKQLSPSAKGGLIAALVILSVIIIIAAALGSQQAVPANASGPAKASDSAKATGNSFAIGQKATSNDVDMTLVSVTENKGSTYNKPADGKVFLMCEFTIENRSSSDIGISSMVSFEAYVDGFSTQENLSGLMEKGSKQQLDGKIASGKKMNGVVAYEVPKNWKEIEISLSPNAFSWISNKTTFKATHK